MRTLVGVNGLNGGQSALTAGELQAALLYLASDLSDADPEAAQVLRTAAELVGTAERRLQQRTPERGLKHLVG
jgi:hypothetical protein